MRGQRKNPRKAVQPFENKKRKIDIFKNYEANGVEKIQRKLEIFSTLISKKSTVMPWIHHRLHPVLVRIFLRLGLSKTLKEERVFSPGERVDHVVLATRGVTARAIGSTKGDSPAIALSTPGHLAAGNLNFFS